MKVPPAAGRATARKCFLLAPCRAQGLCQVCAKAAVRWVLGKIAAPPITYKLPDRNHASLLGAQRKIQISLGLHFLPQNSAFEPLILFCTDTLFFDLI